MQINEKRPERVLMKGTHQEVACPSCDKSIQVTNGMTTAQCGCGQLINWGLRKA